MDNIIITDDSSVKKEAVFSAKEKAMAFAAIILGFFFIKLAAAPYMVYGGLGIGSWLFLLFALFFTLAGSSDKRITRNKAVRIILYLLFSSVVVISANTLIQGLAFIFCALILVYGCFADSHREIDSVRGYFISDMLTAAFAPVSYMNDCPCAAKSAVSGHSAAGTVKNLLLGLMAAIPLTPVAAVLLMSADDGFADMLSELTSGGFTSAVQFAFQIGIGIPAGFYLFALMRTPEEDMSEYDEAYDRRMSMARKFPAQAAFFSVLPLCLLYVMFFFSQASYFLSSFASSLPENISSYSEYARRGFFELCLVALVNLIAITFINVFSCRRSDGKKSAYIRAITCVLCVMTLFLIVIAMSKMAMYIDVFGLTRLRFYTSWFMILLAVVFVGIFIMAVREGFNLPRFAVTAFTAMFALLCFSGADRLIAEYNVSRYLNGSLETVDISMFRELSADAVPAARKLYGSVSEFEAEWLDEIISEKTRNLDIRLITISEVMNGREG